MVTLTAETAIRSPSPKSLSELMYGSTVIRKIGLSTIVAIPRTFPAHDHGGLRLVPQRQQHRDATHSDVDVARDECIVGRRPGTQLADGHLGRRDAEAGRVLLDQPLLVDYHGRQGGET